MKRAAEQEFWRLLCHRAVLTRSAQDGLSLKGATHAINLMTTWPLPSHGIWLPAGFSAATKDGMRWQMLGRGDVYGSDRKCALSRMRLPVDDAAHIFPVGAPQSVDDVRNELSLSPTYHRAFDQGLIFLDERLHMRVNEERRDSLRDIRLLGGIEKFCAPLGPIHLPPDRRQYPDVAMIRKANRFRRIDVA